MKVTDNRPLPDKQPFHRDLDVEVWMCEPDFRIGVDEELISSLESLHEDLYFVTLDFFDALGRTTVQPAARRPGQDLSDHPSRAAPASPVRCASSTRATPSTKPKLELSYKEKGSREAGQDDARDREDRRPSAPRGAARDRCARSVTADAIKELELSDRRERRSRRRARRRCVGCAGDAARGGAVSHRALLRSRRDRVALAIAHEGARARAGRSRTTGVFEPSPVHRPRAESEAAARR